MKPTRTRYRRHIAASDTYSAADEFYMEALWYRWQRRRDLPYRRLRAAGAELMAALRRDAKLFVGIALGILLCAALWWLGLWPGIGE
jgi:hypothetical protein